MHRHPGLRDERNHFRHSPGQERICQRDIRGHTALLLSLMPTRGKPTQKKATPVVVRPNRTHVSLDDIAREAGVSRMTVSRVLGNRGRFSEETRARVIAIAESKRYRPNRMARAVHTGRSMTIGLLLPVHGPYYSRVAQGAHDELAAAGYSVLLGSNPHDRGPAAHAEELRLVHAFLDRRVDAFVLRPVNDDATRVYYREIHERGVPLVAVDRRLAGSFCDFVGTDDLRGGRLAAEYLHGLGHRNLGHLAGPGEVSSARLRRQAFEDTIAGFKDGTTCHVVAAGFHAGDADALALLDRAARPTAVFAVTDWGAAALYAAAQRLGLRIPHDLSVLGFADLVFADLLNPRLSTLAQHPEEVGREAARLVLRRLQAPTATTRHKTILVPPELIVRGSTARNG
jgi:LacI family transcriptional regulator